LRRNIPLVAAIAGLIGVALLLSPGASAAGPAIGGCPVLPSDNVWNTPIDTLPVDARSGSYISTIGSGAGLKADFGSGLWDGGPIGIPYVTVTGSQTKYPVSFEYDDESDPGPYATPLNAPIEGGSQSDGDRHVISIDTTNCILYELFAAYPGSNSWDAGSGAIYDLNSNALRPDTWTSADAAGLPIFPGLVRYDEILAGEINHAIRFTVPQTRSAYVWPARHEASSLTGMQYPPMGQRFRLKASFDISGYSATNQIILRALKKYGMILADNGSAWYMSGVPDSRWNNSDLQALRNVLGSNLEAIDESSLMISPNSGQARQPAADTYGVSWGASNAPSKMQAGVTQNFTVSFTNTSSFTWQTGVINPVSFSYHWRTGACNGTGSAIWQGLRTSLPNNVPPNGTVSSLSVRVQTPTAPGVYCLQYDLSHDGVDWFSARGAAMLARTVTVAAQVGNVTWLTDREEKNKRPKTSPAVTSLSFDIQSQANPPPDPSPEP
jgi:hypothetical protein